MTARTASARGRQARRLGHGFERLLAGADRKRWPDAVVKRADQGERAYCPDFFVYSGGPSQARYLWRECCNAEHVDVMRKLVQAEEDIAGLKSPASERWLPMVVWRKKRSRAILATLRYETLLVIVGEPPSVASSLTLWCIPVTLDYESLMGLVGGPAARGLR